MVAHPLGDVAVPAEARFGAGRLVVVPLAVHGGDCPRAGDGLVEVFDELVDARRHDDMLWAVRHGGDAAAGAVNVHHLAVHGQGVGARQEVIRQEAFPAYLEMVIAVVPVVEFVFPVS